MLVRVGTLAVGAQFLTPLTNRMGRVLERHSWGVRVHIEGLYRPSEYGRGTALHAQVLVRPIQPGEEC